MTTDNHVEIDDRFTASRPAASAQWPARGALKDILEGVERDLILAALRESRGNKAKAARALGITERLIGIRVKRLGIDWRELRPRNKHSTAERSY